MNNEPVITIASITAGVAAIIACLVAFGVDLSNDQTVAILAVVGVVGPLIAAFLARGKVTPVGKGY